MRLDPDDVETCDNCQEQFVWGDLYEVCGDLVCEDCMISLTLNPQPTKDYEKECQMMAWTYVMGGCNEKPNS